MTSQELRSDLYPLCPVHHVVMRFKQQEPNPSYACGEGGCLLHWRYQDGYFQQKQGMMVYPRNAHQLLKPALVREHGYLYIAEIVDGTNPKRTWRCAVKDCANTIIEDSKLDPVE